MGCGNKEWYLLSSVVWWSGVHPDTGRLWVQFLIGSYQGVECRAQILDHLGCNNHWDFNWNLKPKRKKIYIYISSSLKCKMLPGKLFGSTAQNHPNATSLGVIRVVFFFFFLTSSLIPPRCFPAFCLSQSLRQARHLEAVRPVLTPGPAVTCGPGALLPKVTGSGEVN